MNYANAAEVRKKHDQRWNNPTGNRQPKLEEIYRPANQTFVTDELTSVYVYENLVGNLGLIRRTLIQDVFKGREERVLVLN